MHTCILFVTFQSLVLGRLRDCLVAVTSFFFYFLGYNPYCAGPLKSCGNTLSGHVPWSRGRMGKRKNGP